LASLPCRLSRSRGMFRLYRSRSGHQRGSSTPRHQAAINSCTSSPRSFTLRGFSPTSSDYSLTPILTLCVASPFRPSLTASFRTGPSTHRSLRPGPTATPFFRRRRRLVASPRRGTAQTAGPFRSGTITTDGSWSQRPLQTSSPTWRAPPETPCTPQQVLRLRDNAALNMPPTSRFTLGSGLSLTLTLILTLTLTLTQTLADPEPLVPCPSLHCSHRDAQGTAQSHGWMRSEARCRPRCCPALVRHPRTTTWTGSLA